jgi:hypothetical protein
MTSDAEPHPEDMFFCFPETSFSIANNGDSDDNASTVYPGSTCFESGLELPVLCEMLYEYPSSSTLVPGLYFETSDILNRCVI